MPRFSDVGEMTGPLPPEVLLDPEQNQRGTQVAVEELYELIRCLAAGHIVHARVLRFPSWDNEIARVTGMIPYPEPDEESDGMVDVQLFGYDTGKCRVTFRSQALPPEWGDQGSGHLLFGYVEQYAEGMFAHLPQST